MNDRWNAGGADAEAMIPVIARIGDGRGGGGRDDGLLRVPLHRGAAVAKWLGGGVQEYMAGVAGVFVEAGVDPGGARQLRRVVDTAPLQAATQ